MRIRSTKPEFWRSKTIATLDWGVRLVLKGLESYVDDNGVGKDDIALIAADVFPRDLSANPPETLARLSEAISEVAAAGLIVRYEYDGEELLYIDRWKEIQRIDKPAKGRFRRPDGTLEYSDEVDRESYGKPRESVARAPEVLAPGTGEQGNRGTGSSASLTLVDGSETGEKMPRSKKATRIPEPWIIDEAMKDWALERGMQPQWVMKHTERFVNYWRGIGGQRGTKVDWRSTWKNWLLKQQDDTPAASPASRNGYAADDVRARFQ